ncbi:MAG TPA: class IV adenylate cyclase [Bacilli bacterium]|nr:class IV adenylate cyclase [Bacilli bacterium]
MIEIELKFKINNKEKLMDKLTNELNCSFSDTVTQDDRVFLPIDKATYPIPVGLSVIRIRTENSNKKLVTLKQKQKNRSAAKEIEFEINDSKEFFEFLKEFNYIEVVRIHKNRIYTKYKNFNICIDQVDKLGTIIEIERLTKSKDKIDEIENEILKFAELLNIDINDKLNNRYDTLIYNIEHSN